MQEYIPWVVGGGSGESDLAAGFSHWMSVLAVGTLTFSLGKVQIYATASDYNSYLRDPTGGIKN